MRFLGLRLAVVVGITACHDSPPEHDSAPEAVSSHDAAGSGGASDRERDSERPRVLLIDQDADPLGLGGHPGCVFTLDLDCGELAVFHASAEFRDPCDLLPWRGGYFVLDFHDEGGIGTLSWLSADGSALHRMPIGDGLVDPYSMAFAPDGALWIVDKNADPEARGREAGRKTGTVFRLDLGDWEPSAIGSDVEPLALEVLATGPPLMAPTALCFRDDEAWLVDADAYQERPLTDPEGGVFRVSFPRAPLVTVRVPKLLVSPLDMLWDEDGSLLFVDVNADPEFRARMRGGVYRLDPTTGEESLVCHHDEFRDPLRGLREGRLLYVVDANADPAGLGPDGLGLGYAGVGRGAVFRVDLESGAVETVVASEQTVNPVRLRIVR